ncbi:hypothetical protein MVEN_00303700 [Mycena venus]|uniref:Uncharacterized protein n=1 Tax=Mycena venus TaxID=2733690 RepID=A0A8H6Z2N2_9AGAR|nr:hypothetical protein MVEN_00303700 [Mycena venus]
MMRWSTFCSVRGRLLELMVDLASGQIHEDRRSILSSLDAIKSKFPRMRVPAEGAFYVEEMPALYLENMPGGHLLSNLGLKSMIDDLMSRSSILPFEYIAFSSSLLDSSPFRWNETWAIISERTSPVPFSLIKDNLEVALDIVLSRDRSPLITASDPTRPHWTYERISLLLSFWQPNDVLPIPRGVIQFLNEQYPECVFSDVFNKAGSIKVHLWSSFKKTLSEGPAHPRFHSRTSLPREDLLSALWRLASLGRLWVHSRSIPANESLLTHLEDVLQALSGFESSCAHVCNSVIPLVKMRILIKLKIPSNVSLGVALLGFNHHLFPPETMTSIPDKLLAKHPDETQYSSYTLQLVMERRKKESAIHIIAEFLENCTSDIAPYNAVETLDKITQDAVPDAPIHSVHQVRIATSLHTIFSAGRFTQLMNAIVNCQLFALYAKGAQTKEWVEMERNRIISGNWHGLWPWLDNLTARTQIKDALLVYEQKLTVLCDFPDIIAHVRTLSLGFDSWHAEPQEEPPLLAERPASRNEDRQGSDLG